MRLLFLTLLGIFIIIYYVNVCDSLRRGSGSFRNSRRVSGSSRNSRRVSDSYRNSRRVSDSNRNSRRVSGSYRNSRRVSGSYSNTYNNWAVRRGLKLRYKTSSGFKKKSGIMSGLILISIIHRQKIRARLSNEFDDDYYENMGICINVQSTNATPGRNATISPWFACPWFPNSDEKYCCGEEYLEYCCSSKLNSGYVVGVVIGTIFGIFVFCCCCCICCLLCCQKSDTIKRPVSQEEKPNNETPAFVENVPLPYPVNPAEQPGVAPYPTTYTAMPQPSDQTKYPDATAPAPPNPPYPTKGDSNIPATPPPTYDSVVNA